MMGRIADRMKMRGSAWFQDRHRVYADQFRSRSPTSTVWIGIVDFADLRSVCFPYDVPVPDTIIGRGTRTPHG
jgi:hypothetical protein